MNNLTNRELYLLTECTEWQSCSHGGCKARREIERLTRERDTAHRKCDETILAYHKLDQENDRLQARCAELERFNVGLATESERRRAALVAARPYVMMVRPSTGAFDFPRKIIDQIDAALSDEPNSAPETPGKPIPQREGDNRDVSAERCRNAATVSGTPESYSCSDPSEDARTPAGAGIASPVVSERQAPIALLTISQGGEIAGVTMYAPGLPPGDHDLYCEPEASAPYIRQVCPACGHHDRYHFDDGHGNVICRWGEDCECIHRAESAEKATAGHPPAEVGPGPHIGQTYSRDEFERDQG